MDSAMRDLEQLRERGDEHRGSRLGLLILAAVLSLAALVAIVSLMGPSEPTETAVVDPLTELALSAPAAPPRAAPEPALRPESLSFPSTLVERGAPRGKLDADEEALIEATVRAAAAEHAELSGDVPPLPTMSPRSSAELPAGGSVTSDNLRLSRLAQRDPLVAGSLPKRATTGLAPPGADGAFTLQVVSYEAREPAESFAATLRARGHKAFVTQADVPGRGRFFRVRVGPFTTRKEAEAYQRRFEDDEHMHSLVVSNADK
jgi:DedD protein